jgi:hypothetical protein
MSWPDIDVDGVILRGKREESNHSPIEACPGTGKFWAEGLATKRHKNAQKGPRSIFEFWFLIFDCGRAATERQGGNRGIRRIRGNIVGAHSMLISEGPALAGAKNGLNGRQQVLGGGLLAGAAGGPGDPEADVALVLKPVRDLLDGSAFDVVGKGRLARAWRGAGEDLTT